MPAEAAASRDLRRVRFSAFVQRALGAARQRRMTIADIEQATGVGNSTFYRWTKGQWSRDPRPSEVRAFCVGLGLSITEAYRALGWSEQDSKAASPDPITDDPELRLLARKLCDPNTPALEKLWIRRQVRSLAGEDD